MDEAGGIGGETVAVRKDRGGKTKGAGGRGAKPKLGVAGTAMLKKELRFESLQSVRGVGEVIWATAGGDRD